MLQLQRNFRVNEDVFVWYKGRHPSGKGYEWAYFAGTIKKIEGSKIEISWERWNGTTTVDVEKNPLWVVKLSRRCIAEVGFPWAENGYKPDHRFVDQRYLREVKQRIKLATKAKHKNNNNNDSGNNVQRRSRVLREIKKLQKGTKLLIPKKPFQGVIKEISVGFKADFRWQSTAIEALQEGTENFLVEFLEEAYFCAEHAKRKTLKEKDLELTRRIRGGCTFVPKLNLPFN